VKIRQARKVLNKDGDGYWYRTRTLRAADWRVLQHITSPGVHADSHAFQKDQRALYSDLRWRDGRLVEAAR
jgi:hypothetical protein